MKLALALAALLAGAAVPALAQDLTIGRASEPSSIDPQFSRTGNNQGTAEMIFGRLIQQDANLAISPGLATSWTPVDELTWEIKLREGVKFQDGAPFTADDVIFSLDRTDKVPNSPAPFSDMVSAIAGMQKIDDLTLARHHQGARACADRGHRPGVHRLEKSRAEGPTSDDFNSGKAAIGTGPYKFVSWSPGQRSADRGLRRLLGRGARVQGHRHPLHLQRRRPRRGAALGRGGSRSTRCRPRTCPASSRRTAFTSSPPNRGA